MILFTTDREYWKKNKQNDAFGFEYLAAGGFIHCCKPSQLNYVLDKFFEEDEEILILGIEPKKLNHSTIYEKASNGETFPHIYGSINREAVIKEIEILKDNGKWNLEKIHELIDIEKSYNYIDINADENNN